VGRQQVSDLQAFRQKLAANGIKLNIEQIEQLNESK
jgi:hypothetical protein